MGSATACFVVVALTLLCGLSGCLMHLLLTACRFWSVPTSQSTVLQQASSVRTLTRSTPSAGASSVSLIVSPCCCFECIFSKDVDMINALSRCFICLICLTHCVSNLLLYVQPHSPAHVHGILLSSCCISAFGPAVCSVMSSGKVSEFSMSA